MNVFSLQQRAFPMRIFFMKNDWINLKGSIELRFFKDIIYSLLLRATAIWGLVLIFEHLFKRAFLLLSIDVAGMTNKPPPPFLNFDVASESF